MYGVALYILEHICFIYMTTINIEAFIIRLNHNVHLFMNACMKIGIYIYLYVCVHERVGLHQTIALLTNFTRFPRFPK